MAEGEQRIEVLEDEMKVLKGEVSRTLIDLRALLMSEDSPLMTTGLSKRIVGSGEAPAGVTPQVILAPAGDPNVTLPEPVAPVQAPSAQAGVPGLGGTEMPQPPGAPGEAIMPSQGPAAVPVEVVSMPSPPTAGAIDPAADEERARQRRARLQEEEAQDEAQRAQRARRREQERVEEEADQERRERKKQQDREEDEERERRNRRRQEERAQGESDQERQGRDTQLRREEDEERERKERRRRQDREEDEERDRKRQKNREVDEERDLKRKQNQEEDEDLESRKQQDREEDEEMERRKLRREQDREEEEADRERRELRKSQEREEADQERSEPGNGQDQEEDEEMERHYRSREQDRAEADQEPREPRKSREREKEGAHQGRSRPRNQREREADEKIAAPSESRISAKDRDAGPDAESGRDLSEQVAEDDGDSMGLDAGGTVFDDDEDADYGPDNRSDGYLRSAGRDQDMQYDPEYDRDGGGEYEVVDGYAASRDDGYTDEFIGSHHDGYSDDWEDDCDYPPGPGPKDDFDSHEYQEEPKINENNGSRKPRRPDAGRRAYEDSYFDDRHQQYGRGPQDPPRSQRTAGPPAHGPGRPGGRRPAPANYGYAPNAGSGHWGQTPTGNEQWPGPQEWAPEPPPMDLNLVSSLVRWASLAKYKVGEKRLSNIIELYVESRSAPPGLKEALTHIASIVDDQAPESGQSSQETLDLIAHLHGILTAALPVPEVPQIHSKIGFVAGNRASNGDENGDW